MKVKALHDHMNGFGYTPEKSAGTIYEVPDADGETLVIAGHCEKAPDDAELTPAPAPVALDVSININTDKFEEGMALAKTGKGKGSDGAAG